MNLKQKYFVQEASAKYYDGVEGPSAKFKKKKLKFQL